MDCGAYDCHQVTKVNHLIVTKFYGYLWWTILSAGSLVTHDARDCHQVTITLFNSAAANFT